MDTKHLTLVPSYQEEMLNNTLKTRLYPMYELLQRDDSYLECCRLIEDIQSKGLAVCAIYLMKRWPLQDQVVHRLIPKLRENDELSDEQKLALTELCVRCMRECGEACALDLIILLYKNHQEGFKCISVQIHNYMRQCTSSKVGLMFIEIYIKKQMDLLEQHELAFDSDFVAGLNEIRQFWDRLPNDIQHPYMSIIKASAYIALLDVPCPIGPDTIQQCLQYEDKLISIINRAQGETSDLIKGCLIQIGQIRLVYKLFQLDNKEREIVRQWFIESIVQQQYKLTNPEQKCIFLEMQFEDELRHKVYQLNACLYESIQICLVDSEIVNSLLIHFDTLAKSVQRSLVSQLLQSNNVLHIQLVNRLKLQQFDQLDDLHLVPEFNYLIEALQLIAAYCVQQDITVSQIKNKNIQIPLRTCLCNCDAEEQKQILNKLLSIAYTTYLCRPYFLELLVVLIFEANVNRDSKRHYLVLIHNMMGSVVNAIILRKSQIIDKLIFYLRVESELQETIIEILGKCMSIKFSLTYLQAISYFMSPYPSILLVPYIEDTQNLRYYQHISKLLGVPNRAIESTSLEQYNELLSRVNDNQLYYHNLGLLLDCLKKALLKQNALETNYYFLGRESVVLAKGRFPFAIGGAFSIVTHLKFIQQNTPMTILHMAFGDIEITMEIINDQGSMLVITYQKGQVCKIAKFLIYEDCFLVMNFKQRFYITVNGVEVSPILHELMEGLQFTHLHLLAIGATVGEGDYTHHYTGEIKFLFILDQVISFQEINQLWEQKSLKNGQVFSQLLKIQSKATILAQLNTQYSEQRQKESSRDMLFQQVGRDWREMHDKSDSYLLLKSYNRKKQSNIAKIMDKIFTTRKSGNAQMMQSEVDVERLTMITKNVLHQESATLLDVLKNYGNLDILFFPLHILTNCNDIVQKLLELLTLIIERYGDDTQIQSYLRSDSEFQGLNVLSYLLTAYMRKNGCSIELANAILDFYCNICRPKCQTVQALKNDALSIFYNFEYWQYCEYPILQLLYGRLLEMLQKDPIVLQHLKFNKIIDQLLYVSSIQLAEYQIHKGELQAYIGTRQYILKCVIFIIYSPFASMTQGTLFPETMTLNKKQPVDKLFTFKQELVVILNHITLTYQYDYLKLLNFMVKKPQQALLLELMFEERKKQSTASPSKMLDIMQQQFAISFKADQDEFQFNNGSLISRMYITTYGMLADLIMRQRQKTLILQVIDSNEPPFDLYISILTETLVKIQILVITLEHAIIEQQQKNQVGQLQKQKETQIIRQLLIGLNRLLDSRVQFGHKTYQAVLNLAQSVFKKNLLMEREILDLLLPRFSNMTHQSKEIVIEFLLQCSYQQPFMSQLCLHKDTLEFVRALIATDEGSKPLKEKGQTLTNLVVLHHIENIRFAARKIVRFFHYANHFQDSNHLFMNVIMTILLLHNNGNKNSSALIDLYLELPAVFKIYPDMITNDPELFIKLLNEYLTYLEKFQLLHTFYPDTEYVAYYQYDEEFTKRLYEEGENKHMLQNGGIMSATLYILFNAIELLINQKEAKPLLHIWKRLIQQHSQVTYKIRSDQSIIIEDQEQIHIQQKIKHIKNKSQKKTFMQKFKQSILNEYQLTQYDKYFGDIHLMFLLKFQLMTHQHGDMLYDIFTLIQFPTDNFTQNLFMFPELTKLNEHYFKCGIQKEITIRELEQLSDILLNKFNTTNLLIRDALNKNTTNINTTFIEQIKKAKSPLKYLELFKDPDMIRKVIVYMKLYSYRQIQFCQDLSILLHLHELQDKVQNLFILANDIEQNSNSITERCYDSLPDFAVTSYLLFNISRLEYKQLIDKYENEQMIQSLITQFKVKQHYKQNTHKRGLWYFMNESDEHLYSRLHQFDTEYDDFLTKLQQERYQINNYEDKLRRRMFLKVFAKLKKQYVSICLPKKQNDITEQCQNNIEQIRSYLDCKKIKLQEELEQDPIEESVKMYINAEMITQRGFYSGKIRLTQEYLMFENFGESKLEGDTQYRFQKDTLLKVDKQKVIALSNITEIFPRAYLGQQTAIEIFTNANKTYLFNVFTNQQAILRIFTTYPLKVVSNFDVFRKSTERWRKGDISNLSYLMEVNKYAGRTYNDLNQYPVFPWVVGNYKEFDINNEEHYRKLELPMGAQNPKRLEQFMERFKQCDPEDVNTYFIYGTHYSHSALILSLLMRLEPFASLHKELQSGKFDKADRLFHSLESQWYSVTHSSADVKELIPEFYYLADFMKNKNKFDLGQLQSGDIVSDVTLPTYVNSGTPEQMVFINMMALESEYVSTNLHQWIDLIFGYKSGPNQLAVKSHNLFHRLTYSSCIQQLLANAEDDVQREQFITQVYYYGQTPLQIFKKEHPQRQTKSTRDYGEPLLNLKQMSFLMRMDKIILKLLYSERYLVIICECCEIFCYQLDHRITSHKLPKDIPNQELKTLQLNIHSNLHNKFIIMEEHLVVAGNYDNTLKLYSLRDMKLQYQMHFHRKPISSVAYSQEQHLLVCGSIDTRISAWEWAQDGLKNDAKFIIYGHKCEVVQIQINDVLAVIVSMDISGDTLIHTLRGSYLKLIELNSPYQFRIHPMGYIIMHSGTHVKIVTVNGDIYVERHFLECISEIEIISSYHPELVLSTTTGNIFITSIISLKLHQDTGKSLRRKYILDDMEVRQETNIKVKELKLDLQQSINSMQLIKCTLYIQYTSTNSQSIIIGVCQWVDSDSV